MNLVAGQFIKFSVVGLFNTVVDFSVYYSLSRFLGFNFLIANAFGFFCSVIVSYLLNKKITFVSKSKIGLNEFVKFLSFNLITLFVVELVLYVGVSLFYYNDLVVKLFATAVSVLLNFIFSKKLVFKQ